MKESYSFLFLKREGIIMKKVSRKWILITILTAIIFCLFILIWSLPFLAEGYIKNQIEQANYCNKKDDCIRINNAICPFGCYIFVNKNEANRIKNLISFYNLINRNPCVYDCLFLKDYDCGDGKCQVSLSWLNDS